MGFAISYETTEQISPALQREILAAAEEFAGKFSWLRCEPLMLHNDDGNLSGISKPTILPHPDDVAGSDPNDPVGTVGDLLDGLCALSSQFDIDWEIAHDYSDGPLGYIRNGRCDEIVRTQCEAFDELGDDLEDEGLGHEDFY